MKKIYIIFVLMLFSVEAFSQDMNGDGNFNLADVIASLKFITDQSDTICREPADIDLNGKVDWYDFFF